MFKKLKKWKVLYYGLAVVLVTTLSLSGITIADRQTVQRDSSLQIGMGQKVITIGNIAYGAGTADYTCDGTDDDVQFQDAIDALPANGGLISVLTGDYSFSAIVTRAIPNVSIVGNGVSSNFTYDGVNPIFTAGGNNWLFSNLNTDAGGINVGATTEWMFTNVTVGGTYYAYRSPYGQSVMNDITVASLTDSGLTSGRIPIAGAGGLLSDDADLTFDTATLYANTVNTTILYDTGLTSGHVPFTSSGGLISGSSNLTFNNPSLNVGGGNVTRSATYVVAASNAPAHVKAQADYVCDGVDDNVQIQAAIDALPTGGGNLKILAGTYNWGDANIDISAAPNLVIEGNGGSTIFDVSLSNQTPLFLTDSNTGDNVTLRDFQIRDTRSNRAGTNLTSVYFESVSGITIEGIMWFGNAAAAVENCMQGPVFNDSYNIKVSGSSFIDLKGGYGVYFQGGAVTPSHDFVVYGNYFENTGYNAIAAYQNAHDFTITGNIVNGAGHSAIAVSGGYNGAIVGNTVRGVTTASESGIEVENGHVGPTIPITQNIVVSGNEISNCYWGIAVRVQNGLTDPDSIQVIGNVVDTPTNTGIYLNTTNYVTVGSNTIKRATVNGIYAASTVATKITSNIINQTTASGYGIYAGNFDAGEISGNILVLTNEWGMYVASTSDDNLISNNTMRNCGASGTNAIGLGVYSDRNLIIGNHIFDTGVGNTKNAIIIYANADNNRVVDNYLYNSTVANLTDSGTGNIIRGNTGYVTENSGMATMLSGNIAVTVNHGLSTNATSVLLTGTHAEVRDCIVTNITATQFMITAAANVTANRDVYWRATVGAGN